MKVSPKVLHVLSWVPLVAMGLATVVLGSLWMMTEESWKAESAIHRFFGLWVIALGVMICAYTLITLMGTRRARNTILTVLGLFMASLLYLEYAFIPGSPFVMLTYVVVVLYGISLWASAMLNRHDRASGT